MRAGPPDGKGNRMTDIGACPQSCCCLAIFARAVYTAGTIFGMKPLPLAIFASNWMRPVNPARGRLIGAMVAVMCGVSLVAAAAVDADTPCKLWRFDGYTQFDFPDGGKMTFVTFGRLIDFDRKAEVVAIPPNGGAPTYSKIWGGLGFREAFADWELGNTIWMERFLSEGGPVSFSPGT
jgi:hypothetical protein